MMRTIRLYGRLAKFLKRRVFQAEVSSAAEAVRFLVTNFPQLEKHMAEQYYRVSVDNYDLDKDELHHPAGAEIKIIPVVAGAGNVGRIILGALLIIGSFFIPGSAALFGVAIKGVVASIGATLFLGGVAGLLSPVPRIPQGANTDQDPRKSYGFSGIQQTSRQGVPVPIVYGETLVGSVVISAGVDTVQVAA
jgi:predicted phage tail protein